MGIALVYGATGSFSTRIGAVTEGNTILLITGMMLLLFSMSFKVSAAPFHFWTPDVYDGSPTVFTSFMSTIVKVAGFFAFMRLFHVAFGNIAAEWKLLVAIIVAATLYRGVPAKCKKNAGILEHCAGRFYDAGCVCAECRCP